MEHGLVMPRVVALSRYPVKSFTPEPRRSLTIGADGRVAGDRVLGFRFASTAEADDEWSSKHGMLALVNTPGLARLRLRFDEAKQRLSIHVDGRLLIEEGLDAAGRELLCAAVAGYAAGLVTATRKPAERGLTKFAGAIQFGASPRASINLVLGERWPGRDVPRRGSARQRALDHQG